MEMSRVTRRQSYDTSIVVGKSVLKVENNHFYSKNALCYYLRLFVNFYTAGVVTHDRKIGSRMSEFSPNRRLFTMDRFSKISEVAQKFGLLFSTVKAMY
jgi:hypothetical protein